VSDSKQHSVDYSSFPDASGHFGPYGGRFVSETLIHALDELESIYSNLKDDPSFQAEFDKDLAHYVGRPSPLYFAERWSRELGGAQIFLKREDLNHTGAHKVNNTIGQALLAKFTGKSRVIAETGAGQHGVATATVAARLGLKCRVYMGAEDVKRQALNVYRMKLLGAEVFSVTSGSRTLKDAMNEAMRDWATNVDDTFYIIGTVAGPHPYPQLVRDFQAVIGREARQQCLAQTGKLPDALVACVGGGSNAIGLFHPFLTDESVAMYGVEAGGLGIETGKHAAPLNNLSLEDKPAVTEETLDELSLALDDDAKSDDLTLADDDEFSLTLDDDSRSDVGGSVAVPVDAGSLDLSDDDLDAELDFLADADEAATKLDLARAYMDMGDTDGARDILSEVATEGNEQQREEALDLLGKIGG